MEGYEHSAAPHQTFLKDVVNNFKVADLRILHEVRDLKIDILAKAPMGESNYVSDLYVSRTPTDNMGATFDVDCLQFLSDRSKFGGLISNAKASIQREILAKSPFSHLRVLRDRVKVVKGVNRLESAADLVYDFDKKELPQVIAESADSRNRFTSQSRYMSNNPGLVKFIDVAPGKSAPVGYEFFGSIAEININNTGRMRTFVANDGMVNVDDGVYQYEVSIKI